MLSELESVLCSRDRGVVTPHLSGPVGAAQARLYDNVVEVLHPWPEQQFDELIPKLRAAVLFRYGTLPTAITTIDERLL